VLEVAAAKEKNRRGEREEEGKEKETGADSKPVYIRQLTDKHRWATPCVP
jgi:hypothetical protein